MPPLIVWALGAVGAVVVGRWIAHQARRTIAEFKAQHADSFGSAEPGRGRTLERDPVTGIYRPK